MAKEVKRPNEDWMAYMRNPHAWTIKKYIHDILKDKFWAHEKFVDRMATWFQTKDDLESFGKLMVELYESGFLRAVDQYSEQMKSLGYKVNITAGDKKDTGERIFQVDSESEKSG